MHQSNTQYHNSSQLNKTLNCDRAKVNSIGINEAPSGRSGLGGVAWPGDGEFHDGARVVEAVAEELTQLAHAIADRGRVDVQVGADVLRRPWLRSQDRSVSVNRLRAAGVRDCNGASTSAEGRRALRCRRSAPTRVGTARCLSRRMGQVQDDRAA